MKTEGIPKMVKHLNTPHYLNLFSLFNFVTCYHSTTRGLPSVTCVIEVAGNSETFVCLKNQYDDKVFETAEGAFTPFQVLNYLFFHLDSSIQNEYIGSYYEQRTINYPMKFGFLNYVLEKADKLSTKLLMKKMQIRNLSAVKNEGFPFAIDFSFQGHINNKWQMCNLRLDNFSSEFVCESSVDDVHQALIQDIVFTLQEEYPNISFDSLCSSSEFKNRKLMQLFNDLYSRSEEYRLKHLFD